MYYYFVQIFYLIQLMCDGVCYLYVSSILFSIKYFEIFYWTSRAQLSDENLRVITVHIIDTD